MNTRRLLALTAGVALAVSLAGCAGGTGSGSGDDEQITLRFAWWGSDELNAIKAEQIALFEKAHPNITVAGEPSEYNGYYDKLATQVAGGGAPDAIQITYDALPLYVSKNAIADISADIDQDTFAAGALDAGIIDGKLYALPTGVGARGIIVNPAVFEAAGIPIPDDSSWTWDEYIDIAAQVSAASPSGTYGSAQITNDQSLMAFARQKGEDLYTADGEFGVSEKTAQSFFEFAKELQSTGASPDASTAAEDAGASLEQSLMGQGKIGMTFAPLNFISIYANASGQDLQILNVPGDSAGKIGLVIQPTVQYAVYAKSKHPKEAAMLIDFLLNSDEAGPLNKLTLGIPADPAVLEAITPELTEPEKAQVAFIDRLSAAGGVPQNPLKLPTSQLGPIITKLLDDVTFDKTTPADAAKELLSQVKTALDAS
ncbi:ABC transporter substrate-binding protein [Microbacterium radiodurans]|uniref:Sugar ABC transporter substrate-binding protein n=1 Tax=Microbacterium radiodurans TaxID=661398 RepID=A0A5J5IUC6_9MICO|nr:sugar ABC transporter substrate-binding protein [Microbacterium radiodurans]KAA9089623.1 sugar ABC transporter substrate-binding protein [Microbacterium radiodurans]